MVGTGKVCTYHEVISHLSSVEEYDKYVTMKMYSSPCVII